MNLIVEIGNTNVKIAVFDGEDLIIKRIYASHSKFDTNEFDTYKIHRAMKGGSGNKQLEFWDKLACEKFEFNKSEIQEVKMEYKTPESLGEDRLLNAYAAIKKFPNEDILVIDCGTCITFTVVNSEHTLLGGSISPGLEMRFKALHDYTFKLPLIALRSPDFQRAIGDDTESSIWSGVYLGAIYEIASRIDEYLILYPNLSIIMTGGDVDLFKNKIKSRIFVDSSLTLRGLNYTLNQI